MRTAKYFFAMMNGSDIAVRSKPPHFWAPINGAFFISTKRGD